MIAPALFDRVEGGAELEYTPDGTAKGRALRDELNWDETLLDVDAALEQLKTQYEKVGLVGYCFGGSVAWLAATKLKGLECVVGYYGGQITEFSNETPHCPVMLHFGEQDGMIPMTDVDVISKSHPDVSVYTYPAGHGFNCTDRSSYHEVSANLALERSLAWLATNFG